jgi:protease II
MSMNVYYTLQCDETIPLTVVEWQEIGNPNEVYL